MNDVLTLHAPYRSDGRSLDPDGGAIRDTLEDAWRRVMSGDRGAALSVSSRLVLQHQLRLDGDPALLAETVAVLAASHGFLAINRLLRAVSGRSVEIILLSSQNEIVARRVRATGEVDQFRARAACLAEPSAALAWSERLLRHFSWS